MFLLRMSVAVAVLCALACPVLAQQPLAWKLKDNDRFYVEIVRHEHAEETKGGVNRVVEGVLKKVLRVTVVWRAPDGGLLVEMLLESYRPSCPDMGDGAIVLHSQPFQARLDEAMNVQYLQGLDTMVQGVAGNGPESTVFRTELEEWGIGLLQTALVSLPNKPTVKGDRWTQATTWHWRQEPYREETTFTDDGDTETGERSLRKISVDRKADFNALRKIKSVRDEFAGSILFDVAGGRPVSEFSVRFRD